MKLEEIVCSKDWSIKLRDLGVPQESLFYWSFEFNYRDSENYQKYVLKNEWQSEPKAYELSEWSRREGIISNEESFESHWAKIEDAIKDKKRISAFTSSELGEMLPTYIECRKLRTRKYADGWQTGYSWINGPAGLRDEWLFDPIKDNNEGDSRAATYCYLLENKIITPGAFKA